MASAEENLLDDLLHQSHEKDQLFFDDDGKKEDHDEEMSAECGKDNYADLDDGHSDISEEESKASSDISEDETNEDRKVADQTLSGEQNKLVDGNDDEEDDDKEKHIIAKDISCSDDMRSDDDTKDEPSKEKSNFCEETSTKKRKGKSYDYATKLNYLFRDARFFLVKSNNSENVTLSKAKGVWSTPPVNESRLNKAFEEARNVLLIFSVKESGKFSGFARLSTESRRDGPHVNWVFTSWVERTSIGRCI